MSRTNKDKPWKLRKEPKQKTRKNYCYWHDGFGGEWKGLKFSRNLYWRKFRRKCKHAINENKLFPKFRNCVKYWW